MKMKIRMKKQKNKMKRIIMGREGGLGDRLFNLISGLRLAECTKRKPILWWPKTYHCEAEFSELFEPFQNLQTINKDIKEIRKISDLILERKTLEARENRQGKLFHYIKSNLNVKIIFLNFEGICYLPEEKNILNNINLQKKIDNELKDYLRKLRPRKDLKKKIDSFASINFDKDTVSIHLRRTDFPMQINWVMQTDKEIIRILKKYLRKNPKTRFFLATDSKKTQKTLKKTFKERLVIYPKKYWARRLWTGNIYRSKESIRDSLIELYLLSKTKTFLRFDEKSGCFNEIARMLNPLQKKILWRNKRSLIQGKIISCRRFMLYAEKRLNQTINKIGRFLKKKPQIYKTLKRIEYGKRISPNNTCR